MTQEKDVATAGQSNPLEAHAAGGKGAPEHTETIQHHSKSNTDTTNGQTTGGSNGNGMHTGEETNTAVRTDSDRKAGAYLQPCYGGATGNGSSFQLTEAEYKKAAEKQKKYEKIGQKILDLASVTINGDRPFDMKVHNPNALQRVIQKGSLGLGEAFMEGWWDTTDFYSLHIFFEKILRGGIEYYFPNNAMDMANILKARLRNPQTKKKSKKVGLMHYDMGNEFFEAMLGKYMQYSCAFWVKHKHESELTDDDRAKIQQQQDASKHFNENTDGFVYGRNDESLYRSAGSHETAAGKMCAVPITDLEEAQVAKLRMIGEKLRLKPGMEVLDVGCGWGGLALFLAEHYHVKVVGITISEEQKKNAEQMTAAFKDDIVILNTDYRDIQKYYEKEKNQKNKKFDRIVSVGMFEHVGPKNYNKFFEVMRSLLNDKDPEAVFVLHTIGGLQSKDSADQWYLKYIFPGGCLPSLTNIGKNLENAFVVEDLHSFGYYYYLTLLAWRERFLAYWAAHKSMPANVKRKQRETSQTTKGHASPTSNTPEQSSGRDSPSPAAARGTAEEQDDRETFFRMFYYYLSSSAGAFKSRDLQLWQFVLSPNGVTGYPDVYRA